MLPEWGRRWRRRKKISTDRFLKSLKPAKPGKLDDEMDSVVPGFGVRISDTGRKTFILRTRYQKGDNPTRRAIGTYGAITLADARQTAQDWLKLIEAGKDPKLESERQRTLEQRKRQNSFAAVAEQFIVHIHRQKLRTAGVMERNLRQTFVEEAKWGGRPITDIGSDDVKRVIRAAVDRDATYQAFHDFALVRRLFNWAIGTDDYGLQFNPCDRLNSADLIGERHARERVLSDEELRALWRATETMGYPYGPLYRLLALTGLRLGEACGASWSEFDLDRGEWTIPAERMKKVKGGAKSLMVPLTDAIIEVLKAVPGLLPVILFSRMISASGRSNRPTSRTQKTTRLADGRGVAQGRKGARQTYRPPRLCEPRHSPHGADASFGATDRRGSSRGCACPCAPGYQGRL